MALETIYPFTYRAFNAEAGETAQAIINHFSDGNPNFWSETLRRYSFRRANYQRGEEERVRFHEKITTCPSGELFAVTNEILEWGGMDSLNIAMQKALKASLACLNRLARCAQISVLRSARSSLR